MTTYAVLLPGDESTWERASQEQRAATYAAHHRFAAALAERGHSVVGGAELTHSRETRTLRRRGAEVLRTEGPYAETAEQLTGFYLVESTDLDDLVACAEILLDGDGAIEVRPAAHAASEPESAPSTGGTS